MTMWLIDESEVRKVVKQAIAEFERHRNPALAEEAVMDEWNREVDRLNSSLNFTAPQASEAQ